MAFRPLKQLAASFSLSSMRDALKGTSKRKLQEQYDVHKLFLYLSLFKQQQLGGKVSPEFADKVTAQATTLSFEHQRSFVQQELRRQVAAIGTLIHHSLTQTGDPTPAAAALIRAEQRQQQQQLLQPKPTTDGSAAETAGVDGRSGVRVEAQRGRGLSLASSSSGRSSAGESSSSGSSTGAHHLVEPLDVVQGQQGNHSRLLHQAEVSERLRSALGYSLTVRPSTIDHEEAGLGLFVDGHIPPGAIVALFPGLIYQRSHYRRMPNYPKVDRGNPYLVARFDGSVLDSMPWGRGWLPPQLPEASSRAVPSVLGAAGRGSSAARQQAPPRPRGFFKRMVAASDGPRRPIPPTTWVAASSAEAAALELLEGRHPLALAQFANHPGPGMAPNTMVASYTFRLSRALPAASIAGDETQAPTLAGSHTSSAPDASLSDGGVAVAPEAAWLRAYIPNLAYADDPTPAELLDQEVHAVALVALQPLHEGTEVLFNYRLSPGLLGRPSWYMPVDEPEEDRRWAVR